MGYPTGLYFLNIFEIDFGLEEAFLFGFAREANAIQNFVVIMSRRQTTITMQQAEYLLSALLKEEMYYAHKILLKEFYRRGILIPIRVSNFKQLANA